MNFIAEMTKALAWPVALIVLAFVFRTHVTGLLDGMKLRHLKKGEWEADFEEVAQEVRAELPVPTAIAHDNVQAAASLDRQGDRLIDTAPSAAISHKWNELEGRVAVAANEAGIGQRPLPDVLRALVNKEMIQPAVKDSILGLRNMRNLAVHAPGDRLTSQQAREFVTMAEAAIWSLEQNLRMSQMHK
jgi:hypothetical protein